MAGRQLDVEKTQEETPESLTLKSASKICQFFFYFTQFHS